MTNTIKIPDFLFEISARMNADPSRGTAHPFWQVRHKDYIATKEGYNEHHIELSNSERPFYRSDKGTETDAWKFFKKNYPKWYVGILSEYNIDSECADDEIMQLCENIDIKDVTDFPEDVNLVPVQEVEKIVWTGLTEQGALDFISRKQHDYPALYTYVESAYWSPELRQLQDWIKGLTN